MLHLSMPDLKPLTNLDAETVASFGREWSRFDHSSAAEPELNRLFEGYFGIFPWHLLPEHPIGFDLGCGTGRWARFVAPRVGVLHCIDASAEALSVAKRNLASLSNCRFFHGTAEEIPMSDQSADFGFSLGVLHHVPDTGGALTACVRKLKPGAPFLLYLYYCLENRPFWYRALWRASILPRVVISRLPHALKIGVCDLIAAGVYLPAATLARWLPDRANLPLAHYRNLSFYAMRTDALDRFGTRLEKRFSRSDIVALMNEAGLRDVSFSENLPYWVAVGYKR